MVVSVRARAKALILQALDALEHISRALSVLSGYIFMPLKAYNIFSFFSAMDCAFQAMIVPTALVFHYVVQRLTQESSYQCRDLDSYNYYLLLLGKIRATQKTTTPFTSSLTQDLIRLHRSIVSGNN